MSRILRLEDMSSQGALNVEQSEDGFTVTIRQPDEKDGWGSVEFTSCGSRSPETVMALGTLFALMLEVEMVDRAGRPALFSTGGNESVYFLLDSDRDIILCPNREGACIHIPIDVHPALFGALQGLFLAMKQDQKERPHPQE